jgi:hypothetical protein
LLLIQRTEHVARIYVVKSCLSTRRFRGRQLSASYDGATTPKNNDKGANRERNKQRGFAENRQDEKPLGEPRLNKAVPISNYHMETLVCIASNSSHGGDYGESLLLGCGAV